MLLLKVNDLCVGYNGCAVLQKINMTVSVGQRWAIIGRNGTGKSTLIQTMAALLKPTSGSITIKGKLVQEYKARDRARCIAYVPQKLEAVIPYTVHDFVMLGRYSTMGLFGIPDELDRQAVVQALEFCDVYNLGDRMMTTLSGGELQRVLLAGALAQEAPLLLLDEPTTFLDPAHERLFFRALESAQQHKGLTIVMVTHDINTALTSCTHVLALLDGHVHFAGDVHDFAGQCPHELTTLYGIPFDSYTSKKKSTQVYGTWGQLA